MFRIARVGFTAASLLFLFAAGIIAPNPPESQFAAHALGAALVLAVLAAAWGSEGSIDALPRDETRTVEELDEGP